jgi:TolB-like protein
MIKSLSLTLMVLACVVLIGCNQNRKSPYESLYETKDLYETEDLYESSEVRKARDEAKINSIKKRSDIEIAELEVILSAAENNVILTRGREPDIAKANYTAVDALLKKLPIELPKDSPILVASFVSLDDLTESSTFGRVASEQIASRFKQKGYTTIELKLRTTVFIKKGSGEFLLSRELSDIGLKHRAQAVVVGTYAAASKKVYLTVRVVNVSDSRILNAYDYEIPMSRDVFKMLLKGKNDFDWL